MSVTVTLDFVNFRGTEIHSVRLWCYETASTQGASAGSVTFQFPVHIYGGNAEKYAKRVLKWAKELRNEGQNLKAIKGNINHRMNTRGISYDGSCSRGIA